MVKYAEAEKRRGGESSDRRMAPVAMLERPKMSRAMWEGLKAHIMRERRRKKEELEADEKEKRVRKERENRKKQHAMTLEETREQLIKEGVKLTESQDQKHDLVQQLKKVLHDMDKHRREQEKKQEEQQQLQFQHQQNYIKESDIVPLHPYGHGSIPLTGHPQMMFPAGMVPGRPGNIPLYKMGGPTSQPLQNVLSSGSLKRSRSPSPPTQNFQPIPYVFKNIQGTQASVVPVSVSATKTGGSGTSVYLNSQPGPYYHGSNQSHGSTVQFQPGQTTQASVVSPYLTTPSGIGSQNPPISQSSKDEKHMQSIYMAGNRVSAAHVSALHQSLDHKAKPTLTGGRSSNSFPPHQDANQDKFYVSGVRPHLVLHTGGGVIPVQQPTAGVVKGPPALSGFPVRAPPATSQNPHSGSASHSYSGHTMNLSRTYF